MKRSSAAAAALFWGRRGVYGAERGGPTRPPSSWSSLLRNRRGGTRPRATFAIEVALRPNR